MVRYAAYGVRGLMNELIRFGLLGLGVGAIRLRVSGPNRHLPRHRSLELFAWCNRNSRCLHAMGAAHGARPSVSPSGAHRDPSLGASWGANSLDDSAALERASTLIRVIATLGVLILIQAGVVIRYGSNARQVDSWLPTDRVTLWSDVSITVDRLILLAIASFSAGIMWFLFRSSAFGLETEAVSESERSASAVGVSPNKVAVINWALGSAVASLAGILVIPIITLQPTAMTSLVVARWQRHSSAISDLSPSRQRPDLTGSWPDHCQPLRRPARSRSLASVPGHHRPARL